MSNTISPEHSPRVLFFGMQSDFSYPSLLALLEHGIEVCAVVIPSSQAQGDSSPAIFQRERLRIAHSTLPMLQSSLLQLAWQRELLVWEVNRLADPDTISHLAAYSADFICVACFSQRIPRVILDIPRLGCLNVHPSLLPANRGPVPLFWTFREGCEQTGITIHLMDERMDMGDIVLQDRIEVPDGISYAELEKQCAQRGGELLTQAVWDLYHGLLLPFPQDETKSSYHPFPSSQDFVVDPTKWTACHVYNFIRGIASWADPITLHIGDQDFFIQEAISYNLENIGDNEHEVEHLREGSLRVRCAEGWVTVK